MSAMKGPLNPYASPASEAPLVAEVVISDEGRTVEYEIVIDDLVAWNAWVNRHAASLRTNFIRGWLLIGIMLLISVALFSSMFPSETAGLLAMGAVALMVWLAYPAYYRWKVSRLARAMYSEGVSNLIGRRRLSLSADYVIFSSPLSQSVIRWAGIEQVVVQQEATYLLLSKISAIVVPRRAFATDEQFNAFARLAEELHRDTSPRRSEPIKGG